MFPVLLVRNVSKPKLEADEFCYRSTVENKDDRQHADQKDSHRGHLRGAVWWRTNVSHLKGFFGSELTGSEC